MSVIRSHVDSAGVLRICLERPDKRNALSRPMIAELLSTISAAATQDVRVIVLSGSGPCFSAGADFAEITGTVADEQYDDAVAELTAAIRGSKAVVVASIHGVCMGAALDVAMACDLRVTAARTRFALPAAKVGILYNPDSLAHMLRSVTPAAMARLLLQADTLNGAEAATAGIATHLVEDNDLQSQTDAIAVAIAALPAGAVYAAKAALNSHLADEFVAHEWQQLRRDLLGSSDRNRIISTIKKG
ncbi:enoyl-CoA hydratase/isomerase family protein [Pseudomonas benzenivorans]|uniref:Enoyl-CoA hydratase/isomerase family protein n=1 Tax=Pseudomonas benzenivorans TaxID=556533 RepID=A0ABY5HD20_9PSED|nr:enoyl-CoA hydratase/isomerase family protein [Pseudomonas benzenivorans]UTW08886.1 enoyl-CoA hydratase/isomerase family protein [Pseudomonas benzenivorans]